MDMEPSPPPFPSSSKVIQLKAFACPFIVKETLTKLMF